MNQAVSVYYDETHLDQGKFHGHVLFFVPDQTDTCNDSPLFGKSSETFYPRQDLLKEIYNCRGETHKDHEFHFSKISGKCWCDKDALTERMIHILIESLRSKGATFFSPPLSCKVAILYHPNTAKLDMYGGTTKNERELRFSETMLRILLKGSCHFLFDENHKIRISRMIIDGLPAHREFDSDRVVHQLFEESTNGRTPLRDYVEIDSDFSLTHCDSKHTIYHFGSIEYEDANLLQCADLLLGTFNKAVFAPTWNGELHFRNGATCDDKKRFLSKPVVDMMSKVDRGSGFQNSGHFLSYSVSKVTFANSDVLFKNAKELRASNVSACPQQSQELLFP